VTEAASGYSGTALYKKIGIKERFRVYAHGSRIDYASLLSPLPAGVELCDRPDAQVDLAHIFVTERDELAMELAALRMSLRPDATLWVSWPKKSSKVPTTVTEDVIRELALPLGFVDVKVCAVTEVWSGLKLVVRKELR
jgi:hypothetical protein